MFISIIIPIYKVEKYVRGTLESIYDQKFDEHEFEVICVNDGTPDNSMQIVNEFAFKHNNLHIVSQENQGLSCARNAGLRIAKGEYVWFVDSDDTVIQRSIQRLQKIILEFPNIECFGFDMIKVNEVSKNETIENIVLRNKDKCLYGQIVSVRQLIHKIHIAPVQRFVFKHSFLNENKLEFYPKILHEDKEFMVRAFFFAKNLMLANYSPYRYLVRMSGSIMSSINMRSVYSKLTIMQTFEKCKRLNAYTRKERIYFNDNIFLQVVNILEMKMQSSEYEKVLKDKSMSFRVWAIKGCFANIYYADIRKIIKSLIIAFSPKLFHCLATKNK